MRQRLTLTEFAPLGGARCCFRLGVQARGSRDALAELCKIYWYPTEIDEEIHALCEVFIASEWRLGP